VQTPGVNTQTTRYPVHNSVQGDGFFIEWLLEDTWGV
jgi:hypothetical protein